MALTASLRGRFPKHPAFRERTQPASVSQIDPTASLERLGALFTGGLLTKAEFRAAKQSHGARGAPAGTVVRRVMAVAAEAVPAVVLAAEADLAVVGHVVHPKTTAARRMKMTIAGNQPPARRSASEGRQCRRSGSSRRSQPRGRASSASTGSSRTAMQVESIDLPRWSDEKRGPLRRRRGGSPGVRRGGTVAAWSPGARRTERRTHLAAELPDRRRASSREGVPRRSTTISWCHLGQEQLQMETIDRPRRPAALEGSFIEGDAEGAARAARASDAATRRLGKRGRRNFSTAEELVGDGI